MLPPHIDGALTQPHTWLVTGAAGFIGSHLVERLLGRGQTVVGFDNYLTGKRANIEQVLSRVSAEAKRRFTMLEADVRDPAACNKACAGVQIVLHQAGLGSVPRSIEDPLTSHQINVDGTLHLLLAAKDAKVERFVFASSSSVYGDHPGLAKTEYAIGRCCSPYALTKRIDELYAQLASKLYGIECVGLRYFNVFGPRQDPESPYAAVIPRWISSMLALRPCTIYGDGQTSRDFCYVENVVEANLLAALAPAGTEAVNEIYNVGLGGNTTLDQLHSLLRSKLSAYDPRIGQLQPIYSAFREGDVRRSKASISKAERLLGYAPSRTVSAGLDATIAAALESFPRARAVTAAAPLAEGRA